MATPGQNVQLPKCAAGFLGPQAKFSAYGCTAVSHSEDPVIYMQDGQREVEVTFGVPEGTRINIKMLSYGNNKDYTQYVLLHALGPHYVFLIRPPLAGFYKFQIYALPANEAGPQFLGVYNYLIHCPATMGDNPFPKQYPLWKSGCYLYEPLSLPKDAREPVKYKMFIPNANDVQVKVDQAWHPLEQTEPGLFEGWVNFGQKYAQGSKAKVNVNFGGENYQTLLEYTL